MKTLIELSEAQEAFIIEVLRKYLNDRRNDAIDYTVLKIDFLELPEMVKGQRFIVHTALETKADPLVRCSRIFALVFTVEQSIFQAGSIKLGSDCLQCLKVHFNGIATSTFNCLTPSELYKNPNVPNV